MGFRAVSVLRGSRPALMRLIVRLSIDLPFISASRRGGFSRNAGLLRLIVASAALAAAAGFARAQSPAAAVPTEKVLYRFKGKSDGDNPTAGLIFDKKGALYGTTTHGGQPRCDGTVFKLTLPAAGQTQWTESVLHRFKGEPGGSQPYAGLIFDSKGALYGTTRIGGSGAGPTCTTGCGTVFKLTPPVPPATKLTETVLHSFTAGSDGQFPEAGLIIDSKGTLYGTTYEGGTSNFGTVFKVKVH